MVDYLLVYLTFLFIYVGSWVGKREERERRERGERGGREEGERRERGERGEERRERERERRDNSPLSSLSSLSSLPSPFIDLCVLSFFFDDVKLRSRPQCGRWARQKHSYAFVCVPRVCQVRYCADQSGCRFGSQE
jgi:hypothetical protein